MAHAATMVRWSPQYPFKNWCHGDSQTDPLGAQGITQGANFVASWAQHMGTNKSYLWNNAHSAIRADHVAYELFGPGYGTAGSAYHTNLMGKCRPPKRLFILAGVNDISQGGGSTAAGNNAASHLQVISDKITSLNNSGVNIACFFITQPPFCETNNNPKSAWWVNEPGRLAMNTWIRSTSGFANANTTTTGTVTGNYFIDVESALGTGADRHLDTNYLGDPGPSVTRPDAQCADGIHPTQLGQETLGALIKPYVLVDT